MGIEQNERKAGEPNRFDTIEISGPSLKILRRQARLTQQRLAEPAGISRGYVGVIERESQIPVSRRVAEGLAGVLKVDISDLEVTNESNSLQPSVYPHRQRRKGFRGEDYLSNKSQTEILQDVLYQLAELTTTVHLLLRRSETVSVQPRIPSTSVDATNSQDQYVPQERSNENLISLSTMLREKREDIGIPQTTLARRARIGRNTLWLYEKGINPRTGKPTQPSLDKLLRLITQLRMSDSEKEEVMRLAGYTK